MNVKRPLPALVVTSPMDGATLPSGALAISGFAPTLGEVIVEEGDGRFWVERARFLVDTSTGVFPAAPVAPLQLDYGRHLLRFHQNANGLDGDGVQRTVDVQPPHQTLVIESVASLGVATNVPATPAPVITGDLTVKGRGGLRRVCPSTEPACTDATGMSVRLRVYAGLTTTDANPTKIGEGTLADNGSFDVSVRLPAVGTRWISVSQVATSLSGGGSVESDRSAAIAVRGRPSQPTVVSPTSNDPPFGYAVPVVVSAQTDVDHVVVTADPGIPSRVVTQTLNPTSPGHFGGTIAFTSSGTYVLTVAAEADGAIGNSSTPPVVIVVGDVTPPSLTDSAGQPLRELPTVTVTSGEGAAITFDDHVYSADVGMARARCLDPAAALPCTCAPASGSFFPLGTTTITCSAADASGNVSSAPFNVTVKSSAGPNVSGSSIITEAEGPEGAVVNYQVAASGYVANCAPDGSDGFAPCASWNAAHEGLGFSPQAVAVNPFAGDLYAGFFGRYSEIDLVGAAGHLFRSPPGGDASTRSPAAGGRDPANRRRPRHPSQPLRAERPVVDGGAVGQHARPVDQPRRRRTLVARAARSQHRTGRDRSGVPDGRPPARVDQRRRRRLPGRYVCGRPLRDVRRRRDLGLCRRRAPRRPNPLGRPDPLHAGRMYASVVPSAEQHGEGANLRARRQRTLEQAVRARRPGSRKPLQLDARDDPLGHARDRGVRAARALPDVPDAVRRSLDVFRRWRPFR